MTVKWKFFLLSIVCVQVRIQSNILKVPDYSPEFSSERKNNLRQTFLHKRRQNLVAAKRVQLLDKYLSNNSVYVDGILHEKIDEKHKQWKLVNEIETEFRALLGMKGVKYYFKRDPYWRTWRKVNYPTDDKMVCYRCESSLNCSDCQYAGYWVIDENPPCPYEIVSVNNNLDVCAINIKNSTNVEGPCPTVAQFIDIMRICDNPIVTQWRIQKVVSERYPAIFCRGRDYCEISTFYTITPDHVAFRIVNSTNHITYSKIMKNNKTNYACATDCGMIDPKTKTVSKTDKPLIVDLINNKNKREDKTRDSTVFSETLRTSTVTNSTEYDETTTPWASHRGYKSKMDKLKHTINEMETIFNLPVKEIARNDDSDDHHHHHHHDKKSPTCSSMKHRMEDEMSDEIKTFY